MFINVKDNGVILNVIYRLLIVYYKLSYNFHFIVEFECILILLILFPFKNDIWHFSFACR